jgi:hypothetical protein
MRSVPPPRYPRVLALPVGSVEEYQEAAQAIAQEHRASSEWTPLHCVLVEPVDAEAGIFRLDTGSDLGLERGWEGSVALRPRGKDDARAGADDDAPLWQGPVVEVDDTAGALYVGLESGQAPTPGDFYVRPFDFTAMLHRLYRDPGELQPLLCRTLRACLRGGESSESGVSGLLRAPWPASWNVLWGPPGTGKTHLIGDRVARLLADPAERILVVSTTNDATDQVALSIGRAAAGSPTIGRHEILRVGAGARYRRYDERKMRHLLEGDEHVLRQDLDRLRAELELTQESEARALLRSQLGLQLRALHGAAKVAACDEQRRVLVTTAFQALSYVIDEALVDAFDAPFTTIVIDEAGLLSRATVAALALLAARRIVLVGDPRQLAPIARMSRVLSSPQARWLGVSALNHLQISAQRHGLELLTQQHRMHPQIRMAVSAYQYGGKLRDAPGLVAGREASLPQRRAIWYVLDEEKIELHRLRADRGEDNRSWVRRHTPELLAHLFAAIPALARGNGIFLAPFVGQTRLVAHWLRESGATTWRASTVHQQQGAEADFVVFDTVNAGSHCWPLDEWTRLINVAVSRARKLFVLLASRDEATQPFLAPLVEHLWPAALVYGGRSWRLRDVPRAPRSSAAVFASDDARLGAQLARRKLLHPILSAEQQRLARFEMDGKPRLVRGVAGSGKTVVLASWLVQSYLRRRSDTPQFWVVFANEALRRLIQRCISDAWSRAGQTANVPWESFSLHHIDRLLSRLEAPRVVPQARRFEYNARAKDLLDLSGPGGHGGAGCDALFIDEAQDLGPDVIALLNQLTRRSLPDDEKSRPVNIFYDNAQNVYGRGTPRWVDLGLDLRGRAVVMKESFRSTRPITELAVNVLSRLAPFETDLDQREYIERRLIEKSVRGGKPWWQVNYNEIDGPPPRFALFANRQQELDALADQLVRWIRDEGVAPRDIAIVTMGVDRSQDRAEPRRKLGDLVAETLGARLQPLGVRAEHRTQQGFEGLDRTVLVTTPHSFKGYEAEIVCAFGLDAFQADHRPQNASLYVALTRARSILLASATVAKEGPGKVITAALQEAAELSALAPSIDPTSGPRRAAASNEKQPLLSGLLAAAPASR